MNKKINEMKQETLKEKISKVYRFNDELQEAIKKESDAIKNFATDDKVVTKHKGNNVDVTQKELLEEVRVLRTVECDSGEIIKKESPETFNAIVDTGIKSQQLHDYIQEAFGFSFRHMGIADYLKLTEAVVDYKLEEHAKNNQAELEASNEQKKEK